MQSFNVKAPVRADLSGGTLDLWPAFCLLEGAKTINVSLDLSANAHFEIAESSEFSFEIQTEKEAFLLKSPLTRKEWTALPSLVRFPAAIVSMYLTGLELPKKLVKLRVKTLAPRGSGLGGSSALAVAIASGMARVFGHYLDQGWQWQLTRWVRDAEACFLKVPTGTQDYLGSLFGGLRCYEYRLGKIHEKAYSTQTLKEFDERCLILNSGEMHRSGLSNWEVFKSLFEGNQSVLSGFEEIKQITEDMDTQLSKDEVPWDNVGSLMNSEWNSRQRTFEVNTPRLDEIISYVRGLDILGCKVCGAAQGGSLLVMAEPDLKKSISESCSEQGIQVLPTHCTASGVFVEPGKLEL